MCDTGEPADKVSQPEELMPTTLPVGVFSLQMKFFPLRVLVALEERAIARECRTPNGFSLFLYTQA